MSTSQGLLVEEFDKRTNPMGLDYYWLTGRFVNEDKGEDTDEWALSQGYISVVPIEFDLTAHHAIQQLNSWNFENKELFSGRNCQFFCQFKCDDFYTALFFGRTY